MHPTASARIPKSVRRISINFDVHKKASTPEIKIMTPMSKICHHWTGVSERTNFGRAILLKLFQSCLNIPAAEK